MNGTALKIDTKQRILDSAERLFSENGLEGTSLRAIIADAKVNLAAIHYHYHSKEALLDAVILRRLEPINRQRLELLDAAESSARPAPPSLEAVIEAFLAPAFHMVASDRQRGGNLARLMGRILTSDKTLVPRMKQHMSELLGRFIQALQNAAPELPSARALLADSVHGRRYGPYTSQKSRSRDAVGRPLRCLRRRGHAPPVSRFRRGRFPGTGAAGRKACLDCRSPVSPPPCRCARPTVRYSSSACGEPSRSPLLRREAIGFSSPPN